MMEFIVILLLAVFIGYSFFKMKRNHKVPNNQYTPFDSAMTGSTDKKQTDPNNDTKHKIAYKEEVRLEDYHEEKKESHK